MKGFVSKEENAAQYQGLSGNSYQWHETTAE